MLTCLAGSLPLPPLAAALQATARPAAGHLLPHAHMCSHKADTSEHYLSSSIPHTALHSGRRLSRRLSRCLQVRNLCGCIKIAIDFVAPESLGQCLRLTEERRLLNLEVRLPPASPRTCCK